MQERSRKEKNILYIVVPCYNEEQVLAETSKRLKEKCEMLIPIRRSASSRARSTSP